MVKPAASRSPLLLPVVAAALVDRAGRVLVQQRRPGGAMAGLWEFPGGKIEPGEAPEAALVRELDEELGIVGAGASRGPLACASAPLGRRHLLRLLYLCRNWHGEPRAIEAMALRWCGPAALRDLPMPPADLPLIAVLEKALTSS